jgi:hypothetical protein
MSQLGSLKYTHLAYLSQPAADRVIYRAIHKRALSSIVELGIGTAVRAQRMIAVAAGGNSEIRYTGVDFFEDRPASTPGIALREAYRLLREMDVRVRLLPGDPFTVLARAANELTGTDLLVIGEGLDAEAMARAWMFVPRMIHDGTLIFLHESDERGKPTGFSQLTVDDVERLGGRAMHSARFAA